VAYTDNITLILTVAMFVMYTVAPLLYRLASSTYYNLSLRSANFYGLLFGTFSISPQIVSDPQHRHLPLRAFHF